MDALKSIVCSILSCVLLVCSLNLFANDVNLSIPKQWIALEPILVSRVNQTKPKMKLSLQQAQSFDKFLKTINAPTPELMALQNQLAKTTLELLRAIQTRDLPRAEAEKMAAYLQKLLAQFQFGNIRQFDENTSHLIGREWHEIDYTGEGMTCQKQKTHYLPYGIVNFKTKNYLNKFFIVESKLPYFKRIYRPKSSSHQ